MRSIVMQMLNLGTMIIESIMVYKVIHGFINLV